MTPDEHARIIRAMDVWISEKLEQAEKSARGGKAQEGTRSQVTGGKHLRGVNQLVVDEIRSTGATDLELKFDRGATLSGWYRSSKAWDLLVIQRGVPILAVEYKSMSGSEGKNLNNRADEVFGIAEDARQAEARGILPPNLRRAYIYLMEVTPAVQYPVNLMRTFGNPDPVFDQASYLDRMAIMCERLRDSGLYHLVWAVGVIREPVGFMEPSAGVNWDRFASDLRSGFAHGEALPAPHS
jgi:restriction endonuclease XhoI-like protein